MFTLSLIIKSKTETLREDQKTKDYLFFTVIVAFFPERQVIKAPFKQKILIINKIPVI